MTPATQTLFHDPANPSRQGNCLQAVIASMLDLPLSEVPHFVQVDVDTDGDVNWWAHLVTWLRERGWWLDPRVEQGEAHLAVGPSPRGVPHIAIYRDDEMLHDPHPDRTGLSEVRTRWAMRPCEPNEAGPLKERS